MEKIINFLEKNNVGILATSENNILMEDHNIFI